jgi:exopolysaccharide production protein ExoZ
MYFRTIQFLRFTAALYITLFHISHWWDYKHDTLSGLFHNGYGAIDLFFVISGFVVVQSADDFKTGWLSFLLFLKKRFIRIYPIYWLFLIFFLITGMVSLTGRTWSQCWKAVFLLPRHQGIIRTTWTLQWELYFYFLIGLTVLHRYSRYLIALLFILSLAANSAALLGAIDYESLPANQLYNELVLEFFLGAVVWKFFKKVSLAVAILLVILGALLFLLPVQINSSHFIAFGLPSVILLTGLTALEWQKKITVPDWVVLLGNASYSLYLIHLPIINTFLGNLNKTWSANKGLLLVFVMAVVVLSVLVYQIIEKPVLKYLTGFLNRDSNEVKTKRLVKG